MSSVYFLTTIMHCTRYIKQKEQKNQKNETNTAEQSVIQAYKNDRKSSDVPTAPFTKHPTSFPKKLPKYPDPALQPKDTNLLKVKNINTAEIKPRAG